MLINLLKSYQNISPKMIFVTTHQLFLLKNCLKNDKLFALKMFYNETLLFLSILVNKDFQQKPVKCA